MNYRIAFDAYGGDFGYALNINGAILALKEKNDIEIMLIGNESSIRRELSNYQNIPLDRLKIIHTDEFIKMDDAPTIVNTLQNSSIVKGIKMIKEKKADCFLSAGNSGACMAASLLFLGRLKGIRRPAIAAIIPTIKGPVLILDAGANSVIKSEDLLQFGIMGSIYSEKILSIENPRVALLNMGSEEKKGPKMLQETFKLLKNSEINFTGNIEGNEILENRCDVVVTDGFTGNVTIKTLEGFIPFLKDIIKDSTGIVHKYFTAKLLKKKLSHFTYEAYGAAPLLGVNGISLLSHGRSSALAIKNAILTGRKNIEEDINSVILKHLTK